MVALAVRRLDDMPLARWTPPPPTLGQTLERLRIEAGLLQKEIAAQIGVGANAYSNYERDANVPPAAKRRELERLFGLPAGELARVRDEFNRWREALTLDPPPPGFIIRDDPLLVSLFEVVEPLHRQETAAVVEQARRIAEQAARYDVEPGAEETGS